MRRVIGWDWCAFMISSRTSDHCPQCGGPLASKQAHPFPVVPQVLFATSFVLFLLFADRLFQGGVNRVGLALWCALQVGLGFWLVRSRLRARERLLRCIRCGHELRLNH